MSNYKTNLAAPYRNGICGADCAIVDTLSNRVILARKEGCDKWRFPGGFTDITDKSLDDTAKRELTEEVKGIKVEFWGYVSSQRIEDPRYKDDKDRVFTNLYFFEYLSGIPKPNDDIVEVKWFYIRMGNHIEPLHRVLMKNLIRFWKDD